MRPSGSSEDTQPSGESSLGSIVQGGQLLERLVVIGNFDGVHLGHQAVLVSATKEARERNLRLTVLTFDPHPAVVLGRKARAVLTLSPRKVCILERAVEGLEVVVQHFDLALAALSPRDFARKILREQLNARVVLVGENFRFGRERAGDLDELRRLGRELGFEARAEPLRGDAEGHFSSTRVRALLKEGRVSDAALILGRPHFLSGRVVMGDKRGRTLGFPTANLEAVPQALPQDGVYAVYVYRLGPESDGGQPSEFLAPGVLNLGPRPTVNRPHSLEVHLLDFDSDLYGERLGIALMTRLRDVQKFSDLDALVYQITLDSAKARTQLGSSEPMTCP